MDIDVLAHPELKTDLPAFRPGDTVKVHSRIKEGDKERVQVFEGVVLKKANGEGLKGNFTVRKISNGIGVEKTFFLHSPNVLKIEVVRRGQVRRARLYYLREIKGKTIKIKERRQEAQTKTAPSGPEIAADQAEAKA